MQTHIDKYGKKCCTYWYALAGLFDEFAQTAHLRNLHILCNLHNLCKLHKWWLVVQSAQMSCAICANRKNEFWRKVCYLLSLKFLNPFPIKHKFKPSNTLFHLVFPLSRLTWRVLGSFWLAIGDMGMRWSHPATLELRCSQPQFFELLSHVASWYVISSNAHWCPRSLSHLGSFLMKLSGLRLNQSQCSYSSLWPAQLHLALNHHHQSLPSSALTHDCSSWSRNRTLSLGVQPLHLHHHSLGLTPLALQRSASSIQFCCEADFARFGKWQCNGDNRSEWIRLWQRVSISCSCLLGMVAPSCKFPYLLLGDLQLWSCLCWQDTLPMLSWWYPSPGCLALYHANPCSPV